MAFADHRCLQDYISRGVLPNLFANGQFIHVVATALAQSRGAVAQERRIRGREVHQGVVLRKQKDERYAAVAAPASDVLSGAQQTGVHFGGSFGGALEEIRSATAFVIAAPSWHTDNWITQSQDAKHYSMLARQFLVPVVVDSVRSKTWVFSASGHIVELKWKCKL